MLVYFSIVIEFAEMERAMIEFSDWLKAELERRKWKPTELARRAELDDGIISRALSGARVPSTKSLERIADALDVPVEEVFRQVGLLPPDEEEDQWVIRMSRRLERLPPELREIAEAMIKVLADRELAERERGHRKKQ